MGVTAEEYSRFMLANLMWVYMTVTTLAMVAVFILPGKALFGRERPTRVKKVFRFCNMRDLEHGKSMPSGDAAACAFFCGIYFYVYGYWPVLLIIPMVSIGRVYVHCHWIGDTIIGSILGLTVSYYFFSQEYFTKLAYPFYEALC